MIPLADAAPTGAGLAIVGIILLSAMIVTAQGVDALPGLPATVAFPST